MPDPLEALSKAKTIQAGTSPAGETVESILEVLFGALGIPLPGPETQSQRGGALLGAALPFGAAGPIRRMLSAKPIRAYHGSPHDFDKFSAEKIGTGEGAQAYGHGLYFAEQEATAKAYRDALTGSHIPGAAMGSAKYSVRGEFAPRGMSGHAALDTAQDLDGLLYYRKHGYKDMEAVVQPQVEQRIAKFRAEDAAGHHRGVAGEDMRALSDYYDKYVRNAKPDDIAARTGKMYEVNLHADPGDFLDWDAPLSQQGETVRRTLETSRPEWAGRIGHESPDPNAGQIVQSLRREGDPEHTFKQAGIPGIKYLDQGSRVAGEGSRNYVVFDDRIVEILKKYGLLPAAVGGGASMMPEREGPTKRTIGLPQ